jgi:hypothetical protein
MGDNDDVMEIISKLEKCFRLLENTMSKIKLGELIHRLLHVLPNSWKVFVEQKSLDARCLSNYDILKAAGIEEDIRRKSLIKNESTNIEASQTLNINRESKYTNKLVCNKCQKPGH